MKKLLIAFCAVAVCASSFALKIGTVDMVVLVKNHPAYETNKTLLLNTEKDFRKKLEEMNKELASIQEEGKKHADSLKNPMAAPKAKAEAEKALEYAETAKKATDYNRVELIQKVRAFDEQVKEYEKTVLNKR